MRSFFGVISPGETDQDKLKILQGQMTEFTIAYNEFLQISENFGPFYPQDIYASIDECRRAAALEIVQIQTSGDSIFTSEWYRNGQANMDRFLAAYNSVSNLIREHISKLVVAR